MRAAVLSGVALVLGFYFSFVSCDSAQPVTGLPSFNGTIPFKQWGGYVTVNQTEQKAYYYWFMESQRNPSTDPVVLWLQGGPGCAGTWAIFQEHGPYRITPHEEVVLNPYSWNRVANVIYIDAPAGVGFSYSNTTAGLNNNDNQTAVDNYNFLQGFFKLFPQFAQNDLWITGESYGGVYVPTLVNNIIDGPDQQLKSRLQGYLLGNPVTSCDALKEKGLTVQVNLYYDHALISFTSYDAWYTQGCDKHENRPECGKMFEEMENMIGPLDKDDLYTNFCTENATLEFQESVPNCYGLGQRTEKYFNRPDVLQAIHAQLAITEHQARKWYYCSTPVLGGLNYTMSFANMLPYYNKFFNQTQLKIYVYAGDADIADVPHSKTQLCLAELKRPNVKPWTRWTVAGPKIPPYITDAKEKSLITAGYIETFDKYTFATVKGAGHEVPMYQPMFAYYLFQRFIENGTLLV